MNPYQIPAEHAGMTESESRAITAFESALADWRQGCIGATRKMQYASALTFAFRELVKIDLAPSLTATERDAAKSAASWLGEQS